MTTPAIALPAAPRKPNVGARHLHMWSPHTGDNLKTTFWENGRYIDSALSEIDWFMRDCREDMVISIDIRVINILASLQSRLGTQEPLQLLSGYRSPKTNAFLRASSSSVSPRSLHMVGKAADITISDRTLDEIIRSAAASGAGGIGRYAGSNFVHLDCGRPRRWEG
ncbi:DUF882 domain-containing protein [Escherichia coli]|nr:DUF882 domain-containing protein [Escherichia coli]